MAAVPRRPPIFRAALSRREALSYGGGGALAAGLIGGLALGTLAASAGSYYGYGYPSYYGYGYPSYYSYSQSYYSYPAYYGGYGWGGSAYWASGKRMIHKHARKHARR